MKKILLLLFFIHSLFCFAEKYIPYVLSYEIVSDQYDSKIPNGKYVIEGTIYAYRKNKVQFNEKLSQVSVSAATKLIKSDSKGYFKMTNLLQDSILKFVKLDYKTSYFENYSLKNKHRIKLRIFMKSASEESDFIVKKPVIYCYSDQQINIDFQLIPKGTLTFAYPSLTPSSAWKMNLENNQLYDPLSQQKYPYLFWESSQQHIQFELNDRKKNEIQGAIVSKQNIISFLDSTLSNLGFNFREKTDFITFWAPQMQKENFYLIQFQQNNSCDQFANYIISPTPNHINRFYMLFTGNEQADFNLSVVPQTLQPLKRTGFYLVDWGGIELDFISI